MIQNMKNVTVTSMCSNVETEADVQFIIQSKKTIDEENSTLLTSIQIYMNVFFITVSLYVVKFKLLTGVGFFFLCKIISYFTNI